MAGKRASIFVGRPPEEVFAYLVELNDAQWRSGVISGPLWNENGLIFACETGDPLDRRAVTTLKFKPLLKHAGLPEIRFHDLRHTCATLLLTRNVNAKIVSEMLGHATIAITLDTYSHVLPNMRDAAAAAMEEALS
jgi:site-specific recombinase XerD